MTDSTATTNVLVIVHADGEDRHDDPTTEFHVDEGGLLRVTCIVPTVITQAQIDGIRHLPTRAQYQRRLGQTEDVTTTTAVYARGYWQKIVVQRSPEVRQ